MSNDQLYGCCPHCLDHEDMAHDDPCENETCPGARPIGGAA
jgi:hypothetical protein